jgi:hypothetical protein
MFRFGDRITDNYVTGLHPLSDVENTVCTEVGATVSACGSVLAVCCCFVLRGRNGVSALSDKSDPRPQRSISVIRRVPSTLRGVFEVHAVRPLAERDRHEVQRSAGRPALEVSAEGQADLALPPSEKSTAKT